jgi:hypothetical protein
LEIHRRFKSTADAAILGDGPDSSSAVASVCTHGSEDRACFAAAVMVFGLSNYMTWIGARFEPIVKAPSLVGGWIAVGGLLGCATVFVLYVGTTKVAIDRPFAL